MRNNTHVGASRSRVDGPLKVTGAARYAAEFFTPGLLYGAVVSSSIARGTIVSIDSSLAEALPGVVCVLTHDNRPRVSRFDYKHRDEVAPPGSPFRPLHGSEVFYSGQPVALVVADDLDTALYAASLVDILYEAQPHETDLEQRRGDAYEPATKRQGVPPPPKPKGDALAAFAASPLQVQGDYRIAIEHHNPMEMHATTVVYGDGGKLTVYDKIQGVQNTQRYISRVFGLKADKVHVLSPFVGGAFGAGLRPQYQVSLAVMAALKLERSVRVVLSRDQMFTFGYRPDILQAVALGADRSGKLQALMHDAISGTSAYEDYQEAVVNWSNLLYPTGNVELTYKLARIDTATPCDMRAPGAASGVFAIETAMDELAYKADIDPIDLRLRNYAERDEDQDKEFTSKELRACYAAGAKAIGWDRRTPGARSMREGRELVGLGMASGVWEANMMKTAARAVLTPDGHLEVATATADIGTGTYTILTQIGADALGLAMQNVTARIGDSSLPRSPVEGGSWTAASAGSAVQLACQEVRKQLLKATQAAGHSPFARARLEDVAFRNGRLELLADPSVALTFVEAMRGAGLDRIQGEATASQSPATTARYASYTHSAIFAEVRVDEQLGVVRVHRIVNAVAAGKILNPKTARSQILGGVVFGIGMALEEESLLDHTLGRFMNRDLGEYHVPVNADVRDIEVIFVEEPDDKTSPLGVKGVGEIGVVGTAAAIGNAVYHATGKRIRDLPITLDKLL